MLSEMLVEAREGKTDSDLDLDEKRPQSNVRDAALFAEVAAHAFITQVEFNDWLNERSVG